MCKRTRGTYRKGGYWKTVDGTEIVGLKRRPDGRFYAAALPSKTFGKDEAAAIYLFKQWIQKQQPKDCEIPKTHKPEVVCNPFRNDEDRAYACNQSSILREIFNTIISEADFWSYARSRLLANPSEFAMKIGEPRIAYLDNLTPPAPSPSLESIGLLYRDKASVNHPNRVETIARSQDSSINGSPAALPFE